MKALFDFFFSYLVCVCVCAHACACMSVWFSCLSPILQYELWDHRYVLLCLVASEAPTSCPHTCTVQHILCTPSHFHNPYSRPPNNWYASKVCGKDIMMLV